jgi:hypothetical protein
MSFEDGKMEKTPVLGPHTVWEPSMVTEEQIQALADCGLRRPKTEVGWRPAAGEEFPTEATGKTIVFLAHIELGLGVPAGDFLCDLLFFYRIELVHLVPNSITVISTFIHLYEAYLTIAPHFHLCRHFFELKKTGKSRVVGGVGFMLRRNMKSEYVDLVLPWLVLPRQPRANSRPEREQLPSRTRSGPTSWRRGIRKSCSPCWTTWSS